MKRLLVATLAVSLGGCFFVSKKPSTGSSSQSSTSEPKNHGQARKQEVHERNAERKEAKDAAKGK